MGKWDIMGYPPVRLYVAGKSSHRKAIQVKAAKKEAMANKMTRIAITKNRWLHIYIYIYICGIHNDSSPVVVPG